MAEGSPSGCTSVTQEVSKWRTWPATLWCPGLKKKKPVGVGRGVEVNGPWTEQVSAFFLWLHPHSTTGTVGALGRGLARFQALLLELSFELGKQERQGEPGRQRAGVSGRKKRRERRRKESKSKKTEFHGVQRICKTTDRKEPRCTPCKELIRITACINEERAFERKSMLLFF